MSDLGPYNHFLVDDEEPLLFHAGYNAWFPELQEGLSTVIDPTRLSWIGFSHLESDECAALNRGWRLLRQRNQYAVRLVLS